MSISLKLCNEPMLISSSMPGACTASLLKRVAKLPSRTLAGASAVDCVVFEAAVHPARLSALPESVAEQLDPGTLVVLVGRLVTVVGTEVVLVWPGPGVPPGVVHCCWAEPVHDSISSQTAPGAVLPPGISRHSPDARLTYSPLAWCVHTSVLLALQVLKTSWVLLAVPSPTVSKQPLSTWSWPLVAAVHCWELVVLQL